MTATHHPRASSIILAMMLVTLAIALLLTTFATLLAAV
jgi:hypothetical protein